MKLRKVGRLAATFAITAGLTLGAAACNDDKPADESTQTDTTAPVDPKAAVTGGFEKLQNQTYSMQMSMGELMTANFDVDMANTATAGTMTMDLGAADPTAEVDLGEMEIEMISIGNDVWMQMNGGLGEMMPDGWLHTTADSDSGVNVDMDVTQMTSQMMDSLQDVKQIDENTFTGTVDPGTVDLGEVAGSEPAPDMAPMQLTVKLNSDGLVESITADVEGVIPGETIPLMISFSNYGKSLNIEAPPADQVTELDGM